MFLGLESPLFLSRGTRGPKSNLALAGHWGQLHSLFNTAYVCTNFLCLSCELYSWICTFNFANYCCPKKMAPPYLGFLGSCIQNSKLHTLVFILASLRNNKQTNPWDIILAKMCLPKIFFQNLAFPVQQYTKFKAAHLCTYFGFFQKQQTNKSVKYDSCQNLGFLCSYIWNSKAAHTCVYLGFT